jgi:NitT/TauT family transport system ATP-binding protein
MRALAGDEMQHVANIGANAGVNPGAMRASLVQVAAAIEVAGLSHVYDGREGKVPALQDIALTVDAGRFVVIVGPSGCGKTSLLMMMAGLRHQTSGSILCAGRTIDAPDPDRVGVVFQEASLFPWLTAIDNIEFPLSIRGAPREERRERTNAMLSLVGLAGFGGRYPHELSGGMKQRVSIARGLVQDPPVLLMDEPFAALDEQTRMTMGHELLRIWSQTRKTVVFITHSLTEAVYLADEVLVMSARPGRIIDRIDITLPRPRTYEMMATDVFGRLRDRIWQQIRKEA